MVAYSQVDRLFQIHRVLPVHYSAETPQVEDPDLGSDRIRRGILVLESWRGFCLLSSCQCADNTPRATVACEPLRERDRGH